MPSLPYRRFLLGGLLASLLLATTALAGGTTKVTMREFTLSASPKSVTAGKVTFSVKNSGDDEHALTVIRTTKAASKLPQSSGRASETGRVGKVEDIAAGRTKRLTVSLKKGHYVLICNIPGHYAGGMRADFTVR